MGQSDPVLGSRKAEDMLIDVSNGLRALKAADPEHVALQQRAERRFETVYEMRWALVEQSEGSIPMPLIALMVAWLVLVFASFGYRAPNNVVVRTCFVVSAALIAGAIYLDPRHGRAVRRHHPGLPGAARARGRRAQADLARVRCAMLIANLPATIRSPIRGCCSNVRGFA